MPSCVRTLITFDTMHEDRMLQQSHYMCCEYQAASIHAVFPAGAGSYGERSNSALCIADVARLHQLEDRKGQG